MLDDLSAWRPVATRWASFENPTAAKGAAGAANRGAKGHAFERLEPGETRTLLDVRGTGTVRRIWLTVMDRSPLMLRSLVVTARWDGCSRPAVSAPLGDFFGVGHGRLTAFENAIFASPEGRSFICWAPMPFRTSAVLTVTNESDAPLSHLFYDIDVTTGERWSRDSLYYHCHWRRESPPPGADYDILPRVHGRGRFLGTVASLTVNPAYGRSWWGEGEVKAWLDGDEALPSLCGTGVEDYIGTGWGMGTFAGRYQGCLVNDGSARQAAFYRYHVPDPIFFGKDCRVRIQQIGGGFKKDLRETVVNAVDLRPVSIDRGGELHRLLDEPERWSLEDRRILDTDFVNFHRQDDWASAAYFYLDSPDDGLPPIPDERTRTADPFVGQRPR
jgi:hypothetical protein